MHTSGGFFVLTCGSGEIPRDVQRTLVQLGARLPSIQLPHPGSPGFLGKINETLEGSGDPVMVFLFPDGMDAIKTLEQYYLLRPDILWFPAVDQPSQAEALVHQLNRTRILGDELNTYAAEFSSIFQGGMILRLIVEPQGLIRRANSRAQELLGYLAGPGQDFTALEDHPPGILHDLLDRAQVLGQVAGQIHIRVFGMELLFSTVVEYIVNQSSDPESDEKDTQNEGYYLVEMEDVSRQLSRDIHSACRLEQEGTLATIGQRFIPHVRRISDVLGRTLEDLAALVRASRITLACLPIPEAEPLKKYLQNPQVTLDFYPRKIPETLPPWDEQLILGICTSKNPGFPPYFLEGDFSKDFPQNTRSAVVPVIIERQVLAYLAVQGPNEFLEGETGLVLCSGVHMIGQFLTRVLGTGNLII